MVRSIKIIRWTSPAMYPHTSKKEEDMIEARMKRDIESDEIWESDLMETRKRTEGNVPNKETSESDIDNEGERCTQVVPRRSLTQEYEDNDKTIQGKMDELEERYKEKMKGRMDGKVV